MPKKLRLILGDQLNHSHSWFNQTDKNVLFVMMEMKQETGYVKHHIQKVIAFFLAMRNFAEEKQEEGHQFIYWKLDEKRVTFKASTYEFENCYRYRTSSYSFLP